MDAQTLNDFASQVDAAALALPHDSSGRQNDAGASLVPAGVLIIPLATDPGQPGKIFSADIVALKAGRQGWHEVVTIRDGEVGDRDNVLPNIGTGPLGPEALAILGLLQGHTISGAVTAITGGGTIDPLKLLSTLMSVISVAKQAGL